MALVVWAMANGALNALWGMAGSVLSRMLYGLTVSGLVPAAQTWAIQRAGLDKRMAALATISSGLSCGRLLGPPLAALMLGVSPVAPLWLMALAPLIALLLVLREAADPAAAGGAPVDAVTGLHAAFRCWRCCWQRWSA